MFSGKVHTRIHTRALTHTLTHAEIKLDWFFNVLKPAFCVTVLVFRQHIGALFCVRGGEGIYSTLKSDRVI